MLNHIYKHDQACVCVCMCVCMALYQNPFQNISYKLKKEFIYKKRDTRERRNRRERERTRKKRKETTRWKHRTFTSVWTLISKNSILLTNSIWPTTILCQRQRWMRHRSFTPIPSWGHWDMNRYWQLRINNDHKRYGQIFISIRNTISCNL